MARAKKMNAEEGIGIETEMYHDQHEGTCVSFSYNAGEYENSIDISLNSVEEWEVEQIQDFFIQSRNDYERQHREQMEARIKAEKRVTLLAKMSKEDRELLGI